MKITSLAVLPEQPVSHNREIKKKVLLSYQEFPPITNLSQATFKPGQIANGHAHESMYEIFLIQSGQGTITIDDQAYPLLPGTCILVEPKEVHEIINDSSDDLVITVIGFTNI